jgi:hypothetical protein
LLPEAPKNEVAPPGRSAQSSPSRCARRGPIDDTARTVVSYLSVQSRPVRVIAQFIPRLLDFVVVERLKLNAMV